MTDALNHVYETLDDVHRDKPAATRRTLIGGAAAALGSMGMLGFATRAAQAQDSGAAANDAATIANVAATAEVLATIVNTVGFENADKLGIDATTKANLAAAAREELIHYQTLTSSAVGGKEITKRIWVPNDALATKEGLLGTLVVGDQIFINAYLLGITVFARTGMGVGSKGSQFARYLAEFMGAEAVHRALALQSLGKLGNDRAFMRFAQREEVPGLPSSGQPGFYDITGAVAQLEAAGFGFGKEGSKPGTFFEFDAVSARTPDPSGVNTRTLS
ncbi:MAG TPA: hypothetical protein VN238_17640 [Solirubrobacteraceae bacterium]|nr:hypothetical protein [Solirubrobacteraceae bacterium]